MGAQTAAGAPVLALSEILVEVPLTPDELELIEAVRAIQAHGFGELRVVVEYGRLARYVPAPVRKFSGATVGT